MDLEEAFREVGEFGRGQKKLFFMTAILNVFCAVNTLQHVLVGAKPKNFACEDPQISNLGHNCNQTCNKYIFPHEYYTTIAHEWKLVCSNRYKIEVSGTIYMGGLMAGCFIFGFLADKYGRRIITLLATILSSLFLYSTAFSLNYYMYAVCRFFNGLFIGGIILVSFVVLTETVGSKYRGLMGIACAGAFAIGISLFGFVGYFIYNWRLLIIISGLPGLFLSVYYYLKLLESPRWLLSCGRIEEAEEVMNVVARRNGKKIGRIKLAKPEVGGTKTVTVFSALKVGTLRKYFLILFFNWFVNSLVYYGLSMGTNNFSPNIYVNEGIGGLVELPSYVLIFVLDRLGRKVLLSSAMLITSTSSAVIFFLTINGISNWVKFALATIGKLMISGSFCILYIYSAELFPTVVRTNLMGLCSVAARIGGMIAPLTPTIKFHSKNSPQWIFYCLLSLFGGLGVFFLQETRNKPTINTLEDVMQADSPTLKVKMTRDDEDQVELLRAEELGQESP